MITYCATDIVCNGPVCVRLTVIVIENFAPKAALGSNNPEMLEVFTQYADADVYWSKTAQAINQLRWLERLEHEKPILRIQLVLRISTMETTAFSQILPQILLARNANIVKTLTIN